MNLEKETVNYSEKIKSNRTLKVLTGDEEIVRAFLINRLVNELDYQPQDENGEYFYIAMSNIKTWAFEENGCKKVKQEYWSKT